MGKIFKNCCVFLHHGLAGGELGKDVVWILVVVCRCRDGSVELPPADGDVLRLDGLVPILVLCHHGELVAKDLPRKDLECCRYQPAFQSHFKSHLVFLKSLFEDAIKSRKLQKFDSNSRFLVSLKFQFNLSKLYQIFFLSLTCFYSWKRICFLFWIVSGPIGRLIIILCSWKINQIQDSDTFAVSPARINPPNVWINLSPFPHN